MSYGFTKIGNNTYFFNRLNGKMRIGFVNIDGPTYYFDFNGIMAVGKKRINGTEYIFDETGILLSGWKLIDNNTYFMKSDGNYATGWYYVDGQKCFFNNNGVLIAKNAKKIIDVSYANGIIDWNTVKNSGDIDGVILRIGYGSLKSQEDSKLAYNIESLKRLGIPYGIYLFSYAEKYNEGLSEANFTKYLIDKYSMNPSLGIYLDIESWPNLEHISNKITKEAYQSISEAYISRLNNYGYSNVYIYTGLNYSRTRFNDNTRRLIRWIAQYNNVCNYEGEYKLWQYTSSGAISGINGRVDLNVMYY